MDEWMAGRNKSRLECCKMEEFAKDPRLWQRRNKNRGYRKLRAWQKVGARRRDKELGGQERCDHRVGSLSQLGSGGNPPRGQACDAIAGEPLPICPGRPCTG